MSNTMKWVKASERLGDFLDCQIPDWFFWMPDYLKVDGRKVAIGFFRKDITKNEVVFCYSMVNAPGLNLRINETEFYRVEWLDEEAPTTVDGKEELEGRFAEWATGNDWKFYLGDKVWRREWQAQRTTPELIKEWKKSLQKDKSNE